MPQSGIDADAEGRLIDEVSQVWDAGSCKKANLRNSRDKVGAESNLVIALGYDDRVEVSRDKLSCQCPPALRRPEFAALGRAVEQWYNSSAIPMGSMPEVGGGSLCWADIVSERCAEKAADFVDGVNSVGIGDPVCVKPVTRPLANVLSVRSGHVSTTPTRKECAPQQSLSIDDHVIGIAIVPPWSIRRENPTHTWMPANKLEMLRISEPIDLDVRQVFDCFLHCGERMHDVA